MHGAFIAAKTTESVANTAQFANALWYWEKIVRISITEVSDSSPQSRRQSLDYQKKAFHQYLIKPSE